MIQQFTKQSNIENGFVAASQKTLHGSYVDHWHEFFEIEYFLSGNGSYCIDGHCYAIQPGTLFFMSPVNFHKVQAEHAQVFNLMFSESICAPYYLTQALSQNICMLQAAGSDAVYLEALMRELVRVQNDKNLASHLLSCILAKIGSYIGKEQNKTAPMSEAVLFVLKNFRLNPSLAETAKAIGFAPSYFSEKFKEETGVNYKQFLCNLQFDYAKKLLLCTDMTVLAICVECGFGDYANFVRQFKRHFSVTPTEFRKQYGTS